MADSVPSGQGRIFISYRREETAYAAGWLYDRLRDHYGGGQVFKDVDSIELGDDFVEVITRAVGFCDVLLALIGDEWLTITDELGNRRLDDPDDFVRLEIEAALTRSVRVIPILVDGARMPGAKELPDSLARLSRRQALELNPARFDFDTGRLLRVLDNVLDNIRAVTAVSDATVEDRSASAATTPRVEAVPGATAPRLPQASAATTPPARPQPQQRPTRTWLLAATGTAVVLIVLTLIKLTDPGTTPPSTGEVSPSTSADAATSAPAATATTSAPANEPVVFRDNFSSRAAGWKGDGAVAKGAGYTGGAYRISAPPVDDGSAPRSVPMKASRVWPSAPPRIRIAVEGRRLPESDQEMTYGVLCRTDGEAAYFLTTSEGYAKIEKWDRAYKMLAEAEPQVVTNSTNKLQAVCTGGQGREPVHLELWVNGEKVVEFTDTEAPLPPAGVGLVVVTSKTTRASVAEFDNFVVKQLA